MPEAEMLEVNRGFYDPLWADCRLIKPERFNTWDLVQGLCAATPQRLEVGPGLRPRLPISGTHFVDISRPAVEKLNAEGGRATTGVISKLPYEDDHFDLVCALDIIEHVDDDNAAFRELGRVARPGGKFLLSVPLHPEQWTPFDDFVGHRRRYEPEELKARLRENHFVVEQSASYGMQPKSSRLLDGGMWFLNHRRREAMWWYNHIFMPIGLFFQKPLRLTPGLIDTESSSEVLLVCRRDG